MALQNRTVLLLHKQQKLQLTSSHPTTNHTSVEYFSQFSGGAEIPGIDAMLYLLSLYSSLGARATRVVVVVGGAFLYVQCGHGAPACPQSCQGRA